MERCPTCQARLRDESVCLRCRTDLSRPRAAKVRARLRLRAAVAHLTEGHDTLANRALDESVHLKREPLAIWLRKFLSDGKRSL